MNKLQERMTFVLCSGFINNFSSKVEAIGSFNQLQVLKKKLEQNDVKNLFIAMIVED